MAVVEIQFQQKVFFDIIAAQIVRTEPPGVLLSQLPAGALIERVETGTIEFATGEEVLFADDELAVKVPVTVHVTNYDGAKTAGSLQPPVTVAQGCTVWLRLQGAAPVPDSPNADEWECRLRFFIARVEIGGSVVPIFPPPPRNIRLGDLGVPVTRVALGQGAGVVSIRFFTSTPSAALGPVTNRIGTADWGQFIEGQVFADALAEEMNSAADDAAAGSIDPVIEVSSRATGHWNPNPPAAHASVGLTAVDALPLDVDVPIVIYATTELRLDPVLDRIELRTRISWAAHDFITEFSSGAIEIVEDEVSKAILDKLKPRPGQQEVERGERHVVYRSERPLMEPVTSLFSATLDNHILTAAGVGATGPVKVYPPPVAHFTLEDQHWESGVNCNARRWETKFVPPKVHIFGVDRFYGLRFLAHPTVDPAGFWVPQVSWSGFGPGNQIAHVTFEVPPFGAGGLRPVGQVSSGFMVTNLGVRWVDLGAVPVQPAAPADPVGIQVFVYNKCLQLVDPWGRGVLNLDWLVDPPDLDLGMPPLREWTLVGTQIFEVDRIGLAAVGPAGERQLAVVPVRGNSVFAQVVTDADETLEVRSRVALSPTPPQIMQRWIVPWSSAPVGSDTRELAISDGDLLVLDRESVSQIKLPGSGRAAMTHRLEPDKLPARLAARLHQSRSNAEFSAPRTVGNGRSVAVLHRGMVVLGFAGPLVRVTEGLSRARG